MSEIITNIHHLQTYDFEKPDFEFGILGDVPRMLANTALATKLADRQRSPLNAHMTWLGHEGGISVARQLLKQSSKSPVRADSINEGTMIDENFWIAARRLNAEQLAGSVIAQKGVSLFNEFGQLVINNGILVEAVTIPSQKHELPSFYQAGIEVATEMAKDGEIVFSVEAAETDEDRQSRIKRWISGGLKHDEEIHMSVFRHYMQRTDIVKVVRSDFKRKKPVPAIIYSDKAINLKPTLDNLHPGI